MMVLKTGPGEFMELTRSHCLGGVATVVTCGCDSERRREGLTPQEKSLPLLWGMPGPSGSPL